LVAIIYFVTAAEETTKPSFSPEILYKQTIAAWQKQRRKGSPFSWDIWKNFAKTVTSKYETIIGADGEKAAASKEAGLPNAVEIVGAIEEGILKIEQFVFEQEQSGAPPNQVDDEARDSALVILYTEYGRLLWYSSEIPHPPSSWDHPHPSHRCWGLAKDPQTLLIGAPERINEYRRHRKKVAEHDHPLLVKLFGPLCRDNAENAIRNALSMDETHEEAIELLQEITSSGDANAQQTRKPKEFVAEIFDAFADTFDEQLTKKLEYRVPQIIGDKVGKILKSSGKKVQVRNVLDAGCGTGLAGRELRTVLNNQHVDDKPITLVGVDASPKMLEIAGRCTSKQGCGLPTSSSQDDDDSDPLLYDALVDLDLEEMTIENTLLQVPTNDLPKGSRFDLIVAADVFVYFGSLDAVLEVFSRIHAPGGLLIFTCERDTQEASSNDLGYRLTSTGRFAHTKEHVVGAAQAAGYSLVDYSEIVPRLEKEKPVDGHLFVFSRTGEYRNEGEL